MSGKAEIIDGVKPDVIGSDPEKIPSHTTNEQWGDQITHEMLEELAPNGEGDYILEKINTMSEEEAIVDFLAS